MPHPITSVVAVGESLVDVIVPSDGAPITEHPGGSPMNVALGIARLGRPVTLVTRIGSDRRGTAIAEHLSSAGAQLARGSVRDEPTSTATAQIRADGSAKYAFDLRWSLPQGFTVADPVIADAGIVHVGSIGAFLEPGGSAVAELLSQLSVTASPPIVTLDPNIRPSVVHDHTAALARFEQLARSTAVVKLSDEDAAWLYPGTGLDETVDLILALGPGVVALTLGGAGALMATRSTRLTVPGIAVEVADTIGAGDSFMSAMIHQLGVLLDAGVPTEELRDGTAVNAERLALIGEFAVRCAAITVSRDGANPPTLAELVR